MQGTEVKHVAMWVETAKLTMALNGTSQSIVRVKGLDIKCIESSEGSPLRNLTIPQILSYKNELLEFKEDKGYVRQIISNSGFEELTDKCVLIKKLLMLKDLVSVFLSPEVSMIAMFRDPEIWQENKGLQFTEFETEEGKALIGKLDEFKKFFDNEELNFIFTNINKDVLTQIDTLLELIPTCETSFGRIDIEMLVKSFIDESENLTIEDRDELESIIKVYID